jgi:hypothetical protein
MNISPVLNSPVDSSNRFVVSLSLKHILPIFMVLGLAIIVMLASPLRLDAQDASEMRRKMMESSRPTMIVPSNERKIQPALLNTEEAGSPFLNVNLIEQENDNLPTQNESSIAVNPLNPNILLASAVDYRSNSSTWVYVSTTGGKTWRNVNLGSPPGLNFTSSNDPSVAWDYQGRGYLMYGGFDRQRTLGQNGVFLSVTTDNGVTWQSHKRVILHFEGTQTPDSSFEDKYYVVVDNARNSPYKGHIYTPWKRVFDRDSSTQIVVTKSTDQGNTWSTPIRVSDVLPSSSLDTTFGQSFPIVITGAEGEVYTFWNHGPRRSVGFNKSLDGGKTWGSPRLIQQYNWLGVARFTGGQYNHTLKGGTRVETYPSIVVDTLPNSPRKGWIYLTWAGDRTPNIYFSRSTDKGETWSTPKIVHSDTTNDQYWQWISIDGTNGDLAITYLDSRDDPDNQLSRSYVSFSSDGGSTWIDRIAGDIGYDIRRNPFGNANLSGTFAGDYSGCAFWNGKVYPSHVDMRNTYGANANQADNDVYIQVINVRAPMPVSDFKAVTLPLQPTNIELRWKQPTERSFKQALQASEYNYVLYRDGVQHRILPSSVQTYLDTVPTSFATYEYSIVVASAGDSSAPMFATGYSGGSRQPGAPTLISVASRFESSTRQAVSSVRIPSLRADGVNPLVNLAKLRLYRDSVLIREITLSASDTAKTFTFADTVSEDGYYRYFFRTVDAFGNESASSNELLEYIGELKATYADNFDAGTLRRYLVRNGFTRANNFAFSSPNSLTQSATRPYRNFLRDTITLFPVVTSTGFTRVEFMNVAAVVPGDSAWVEYSVDNRKSWTRQTFFNRTMFAPWADGTLGADDWRAESITIRSTANDTVYVRLRFTSNVSQNDAGWFVDDLRINEAPVSVEEQPNSASYQNQVAVYPNPATTNIRLNEVEPNATIEIYSSLGVLVKSVKAETTSPLVDCSELAVGTYMVRVSGMRGTAQTVLTVVR